MIKEFFRKKENIFIILIAVVSLLFVLLGFLFLFFKSDPSDGPKRIPNSITDIVWESFDSKLISNKLQYPEHMHVSEQKEETGVGINVAEFEPREFLTYFSNQNHVSIYPGGIDVPLFYGKTRESEYTSSTNQSFMRTEYLTTDNQVWAVMLVPKEQYENWQARGFIWIQTRVQDRETMCLSNTGILIDSVDCDPFAGEKTVYSGTVSDKFIRVGYEIVNKNSFK
jgi:hypothetical protein